MNSRLLDLLRDDLHAARYRLTDLVALWGSAAEGARLRGVVLPAVRELARQDPQPLATIARVFLLGQSATAAELNTAFPSLGAAGLVELGIARERGSGELIAELSLNPVVIPHVAEDPVEWWILSDLDDHLRQGPAKPDHVMGVGGATRSLIAQGVPRSLDEQSRVLDLGTGCGIVAMALAASGSQRVVATDISERALHIARANAHMNGLSAHIEFRQGNLFEPVSHDEFDLIVSNPPFVITPRSVGERADERFEYRDGGLTGDELAARVVREAPKYLAPHGVLVCLANWESPWGSNGLERVRSWIGEASELAHAPLDAWVIERDQVDPAQYAETWARDGGARQGSDEFTALLGAWLDDFSERRIVSIGLGSIRVRRAVSGESVIRAESAMGMFAADGVEETLSRAFEAGVDAERMSDDDARAARWIRNDRLAEEREFRPGSEDPRALRFVIDAPIGRRIDVDPLLASAIGACDGDLTLEQIADALATLLDVERDDASRELLAGMRELAWYGMVTPGRS